MIHSFWEGLKKQAGAELDKSQPKLGLGRIKINLAMLNLEKLSGIRFHMIIAKKIQSLKVDAAKVFVPSQAILVVS